MSTQTEPDAVRAYHGPGSWDPLEVAGYLHAGVPQRVMRAVLATWTHPGDYEHAWQTGRRELGGRPLPSPAPALRGLPRDQFVTLAGGPDYPAALLTTPAAPLALFGRGNPSAATRPGLAVVGSCDISPYGRAVAQCAVAAALSLNVPVVSGGAAGVDEVAHRAALDGGGLTVAVVATGADERTPLLDAIVTSGGVVLSEHPFGTGRQVPPGGSVAPYTSRLVARNRLTVGLSVATVIAEARPFSGTTHAVWATLALGRPLLVALPRPGSAPVPGAQVPAALALDQARTAGALKDMGAPAALALALAGRSPLASGVARDRDELAELVRAAVLMSPLR